MSRCFLTMSAWIPYNKLAYWKLVSCLYPNQLQGSFCVLSVSLKEREGKRPRKSRPRQMGESPRLGSYIADGNNGGRCCLSKELFMQLSKCSCPWHTVHITVQCTLYGGPCNFQFFNSCKPVSLGPKWWKSSHFGWALLALQNNH